jgi:hypothetical protein
MKWEEFYRSCRGVIDVAFRHLFQEMREIQSITSVRIARVPVEFELNAYQREAQNVILTLTCS